MKIRSSNYLMNTILFEQNKYPRLFEDWHYRIKCFLFNFLHSKEEELEGNCSDTNNKFKAHSQLLPVDKTVFGYVLYYDINVKKLQILKSTKQ